MHILYFIRRRLWDPDCESVNEENVQEWHSHVYGKVGIFMFDLRSNRISPEGNQLSDNALISDDQWQAFEEFMENPDLKAIILCSETPFLGDEPSKVKEQAENIRSLKFLRDHWAYNDEELFRLIERCFAWKSEDPCLRDMIFVAGDIHCGVTITLTGKEF